MKRGFRPDQIALMKFVVKEDEDPIGENGIAKRETCKVCLWHIEKGNHVLEMTCKHRIHKKCTEVWFMSSNECPVCGKGV